MEEAGYSDFHVRMDNRDFGLFLGNFVGKRGVGLNYWINTPVDIA